MPSLLKAIDTKCRILNWQNYFRTSKISSHYLLHATVSVEKSTHNLTVASLKIIGLSSSGCFQYFLFVFDFQQCDLDVPRYRIPCVYLVEVQNFPKSLPIVFYQFWRFSRIISSDIASVQILSLFFLGPCCHLSCMYPPCTYVSQYFFFCLSFLQLGYFIMAFYYFPFLCLITYSVFNLSLLYFSTLVFHIN